MNSATWTRAEWSDLVVGDRLSLFCGVPVSVQEVMPAPPNAIEVDGIWWRRKKQPWMTALHGPRFLGPPAAIEIERDVVTDQPLWREVA